MITVITALKTLLTGKYTYSKITTINFFNAESYPAICFEPMRSEYDDQCLGGGIAETHSVKLWYIEKAGKDRDMTAFINKAEAVAKAVKPFPMIAERLTMNYRGRDAENNVEFLAEITLQGETI